MIVFILPFILIAVTFAQDDQEFADAMSVSIDKESAIRFVQEIKSSGKSSEDVEDILNFIRSYQQNRNDIRSIEDCRVLSEFYQKENESFSGTGREKDKAMQKNASRLLEYSRGKASDQNGGTKKMIGKQIDEQESVSLSKRRGGQTEKGWGMFKQIMQGFGSESKKTGGTSGTGNQGNGGGK